MRQQTSVIGGDESGAHDGADGLEDVPINQDQAVNSSSGNEGEKRKYLVLSRPGKRLWRADSDNAKVLQTLNFQGSLTQAQLLPLFEDFLSEGMLSAITYCYRAFLTDIIRQGSPSRTEQY